MSSTKNKNNNYVPLSKWFYLGMENEHIYLNHQVQWATDLIRAMAYFDGLILVELVSGDGGPVIVG